MDRRFALVALWAVFAAAAVGVGFAAAGLVSDPLTDASSGAGPVIGASVTADPSTSPGQASPSPAPSGSGSSGADGSSPPETGGTDRAGAVRRTINTRGGLVSAVCRQGLVRVSAAPTVGWEIEDIERRLRPEARVRFEQSGDRDTRVEVRTSCVGGVPRFVLEDNRVERDG